ncbi:serine hydrolase domain-containing protein [Nocardiopsis algeriensis]|uniref:D-alanyl-D-alanine carboxypeptidase n=1 Tax=Nocardiopsis algeriensis TaxID=1478215 RepID=A0A841IP87_9ACTN|nr:serine hydrolase domain-containing protein [Nocardiopsis algeriensis]MBB6120000.1 D-alanyl-D-alanine carboxypeptidase [Nocardiopsis algeriensis]
MSETNSADRDDAATGGQGRPELQKAVQEIVDSGFSGMQLRVNDRGREWVGSAGVRKLGETAEPPIDGHFRIGSTTKTLVATVVLRLVAENRLGLDDPVAAFLPGFGLDGRITVRMLLQHTSGIFNFTGEFDPDGTLLPGIPVQGQEYVDNLSRTYQPQELVLLALSEPARFEPGTDWSYSNTNYVLAKLLIEEVTGCSLASEMRRLVLEPLGMSNTVVPDASPEIPEPHAHGYYRYEDAGRSKLADVTRMNPSWVSSAGDMISTTRDLHTFVSALMGGELLPAPLLAEMCTPHPKSGDFRYGLGLFVEDTDCGGTVVHHNGGFAGWAALMYSTPDGSTTLTASLTTGDTEFDFGAMAQVFEKAKQRLVTEVFCNRPT